ncbi:MAG TPA: bifunctional (p)ppGpp synthetase/guanosine-3',5'-bis(diphosphate) 3'-pyrophosphohydrolase [Anaerolineae bacterium]|nr:bifunctional (p)ppGpp synthetase/guanosine-3',5'-bis(diphosphate) 3'-pyrophosphohydrolase [Anaerolineae bacterium]
MGDGLVDWVAEYFSGGDLELVRRAYELADRAHDGQMRLSGERYVVHCVEVARILAEMGLDSRAVAAAFLHDVAEDTSITIDELQSTYGDEVARLVDGVTKLSYIDTMSKMGSRDLEAEEAESLRKMFLAMAEDIRVVLIKLADRLHNMRTLASLPPERRARIARETLEIFAPLANRLGIWRIKWELEDLGLRYHDPHAYSEIAGLIAERRESRERYIQRVVAELRTRLRLEGIAAEVEGRPKHIYSIYRKMRRKGVDFGQIYDVRGLRVIVDSVQDCYAALGVAHALWKPIPGEFDDFIATPKDNMYQSLHSAVVGPDGRTLEVQIRTRDMHRRAELGIAAHWRYKEGTKNRDVAFESKVAWLRSLMDWRSDVEDAREFVDALKAEVLAERVYVFTPKGQVLDLPAGSTSVDFAYHIHTDVGHRCRGARVNGQIVPLTHTLVNGDQVEIITAKQGGPSRDWLRPDLGYVHSPRARQKIRAWFRQQDREQSILLGREQLRRELRRLNLSDDIRYQEIASLFDYKTLDDFFASIGYGDLSSQRVAARVLQDLRREEIVAEEEEAPVAVTPEGIRVRGVGDVVTQLAHCCQPSPEEPDPIIGYVTRGHGVTIHRWDCPNILARTGRGEIERLIEVDWGKPVERIYPVHIRIRAWDREGLLRDIATVVAEERVNMRKVGSANPQKTNLVTLTATLEITAMSQLVSILDRIERLPNVVEVRREAR